MPEEILSINLAIMLKIELPNLSSPIIITYNFIMIICSQCTQ